MIHNYLKIARRNLLKYRTFTFINVAGLSLGMLAALLIGLWIWDEVTFNTYHENYNRIAQVLQNKEIGGAITTQRENPLPLGSELRTNYRDDFKYVVMSSGPRSVILSSDREKKFTKTGYYFEPGITEMLTLKMLRGSRDGLKETSSVLLSASLAKAFFGDADPMDKNIRVDNKYDVNVAGVYEDLPDNSEFRDMQFIAPWARYIDNDWDRAHKDDWGSNSFFTYVQIADNAVMERASADIRNVKLNKVSKEDQQYKPQLFLHPMNKWRLYSDFENGVEAGGRIKMVWLFATIGLFVLLLACINFMNLVTARSERRAKEIGIRKSIGSLRGQLVLQFFTESLLVAGGALILSLLLAWLLLPYFNELADKKINIQWGSPWFWVSLTGFTIVTGLIAGSYPAFYLSSFQPVKVLKGTFRTGRLAAVPRKVLVVLQFTISIVLIIGVIIVFRQISFTQNRPVGYDRDGLITLRTRTADLHQHFEACRNDLLVSGAVLEMAESYGPLTAVFMSVGDYQWPGKGPALKTSFATLPVSCDFGKTIGWKIIDGRDFSREFASDSTGLVLNEAAVKLMGLRQPVGATIRSEILGNGVAFKVIGVIKDMVMESPYEPAKPSVFMLNREKGNFVVLKLNPAIPASGALAKIEAVMKNYNANEPFEYSFVSQEYDKKFGNEERMGKLSGYWAMLAIFISCIGLFGMASFAVEQRVKEIGVRKVLGASVLTLWRLLTKQFVVLILVAAGIATPVAYFAMQNWLSHYPYHAPIPWWLFPVVYMGALLVALGTVSFQAIRASTINPVKSLRAE